ncbi:MAG: MBL fold metallo-hydrolase [Bryobacteraceae bacterium]
MQELAHGVAVIKTLLSNAYLVGDAKTWILIDALGPGRARTIKQAAEAFFGPRARPQAIVLTHGHYDHVSSAAALADFWKVKIYAHRLERPYLTGQSSYPPLDPTAPGFFSGASRLIPTIKNNLGSRLADLDTERPLPWLPGWTCHFTPGHSPGHVSFFRSDGKVLLAGDAVTTMNLDSLVDTVLQRQQVCRPPAPATIDWKRAHDSVRSLASLRPRLLCAGHGRPMSDAAEDLRTLAAHFPIPAHGRYVNEPAIADEHGVVYLPPAPFDIVPQILAIGALSGIAAVALRKRYSKKS